MEVKTSNYFVSILDKVAIDNLIEKHGIINPSNAELVYNNGIDIRLADEYFLLKRTDKVFDTEKDNDMDFFFELCHGSKILVCPGSTVLVCSMERLTLPNDVIAFANLRSSYARLGLLMPLGIVDPGFCGNSNF